MRFILLTTIGLGLFLNANPCLGGSYQGKLGSLCQITLANAKLFFKPARLRPVARVFFDSESDFQREESSVEDSVNSRLVSGAMAAFFSVYGIIFPTRFFEIENWFIRHGSNFIMTAVGSIVLAGLLKWSTKSPTLVRAPIVMVASGAINYVIELRDAEIYGGGLDQLDMRAGMMGGVIGLAIFEAAQRYIYVRLIRNKSAKN